MSESDEDRFLDLLYGAAARPELWPKILERFADMIGGTSGWLSRLDQRDGTGSVIISRLDPVWVSRYEAYFARRNPFTTLMASSDRAHPMPLRRITDQDRLAKDDLLRTEFYNDFMLPQDVHSTLMIGLATSGFEACVLNIYRPKTRDAFDAGDLALVARWHPHLVRAFDLGQKLAADRALNQGAAAVFDGSRHGLFQLDPAGKILRVNAAGEALLREGGGLTMSRGRLTASTPDVAARLGALIAAGAAADPEQRAGDSMALYSPTRAHALSIVVAPLPAEGMRVFHGQPSVLVCVTDLEADVNVSENRLRELFRFTPAEARLAVALHGGATPREAAAALGISINTANVQTARMFEKTGVNRQAALVRLLTRAEGTGQG